MVLSESEHTVAAAATVNGASDGGGPAVSNDQIAHSGPRIPKRLIWVDVPEYDGFQARVWCNYPKRLALELGTEDIERIRAAMMTIVLEHNGWLDDEGNPFPPADTRAFWDAIPNELAAMLIRVAAIDAPAQLPNSSAPRMRRR